MANILNHKLAKEITEFIRSKNGVAQSAMQVSLHFNVTQHYASDMLAMMVLYRYIQHSFGNTLKSFVIFGHVSGSPTAAARPQDRGPLKIDWHRLELYKELAEARTSMPSIG